MIDYKSYCAGRGERYPDYLGDGVYASFDGFQVWLRVERESGFHEIALDPHTLDALMRYRDRANDMAQRQQAGIQ